MLLAGAGEHGLPSCPGGHPLYFIDREGAAVERVGRQGWGGGDRDSIWKRLGNRWGKSGKTQFVVFRYVKECLDMRALGF